MANPKISVPTSAIAIGNGDGSTSSTRIPPSLFSDITSALLSTNAIPRIQAALQNELDAVGWTSRVQKRVLQLLREEQCSTYNDVMTVILAEVKASTTGNGKDDPDDDHNGDSDQDADADGDDNEDDDGDEKDKSDRDAENDGDGGVDDADDDDDGDDDDEDDKDDKGSVIGKATSKSRRKSNASNAPAVDGTSANANAANKKRKVKSEASGSDSKSKSRRQRQQLDTKGIKIPKRAVKEGLRVVRKELEEVCEIVPDGESNG